MLPSVPTPCWTTVFLPCCEAETTIQFDCNASRLLERLFCNSSTPAKYCVQLRLKPLTPSPCCSWIYYVRCFPQRRKLISSLPWFTLKRPPAVFLKGIYGDRLTAPMKFPWISSFSSRMRGGDGNSWQTLNLHSSHRLVVYPELPYDITLSHMFCGDFRRATHRAVTFWPRSPYRAAFMRRA